jgi:hypothetical protein
MLKEKYEWLTVKNSEKKGYSFYEKHAIADVINKYTSKIINSGRVFK